MTNPDVDATGSENHMNTNDTLIHQIASALGNNDGSYELLIAGRVCQALGIEPAHSGRLIPAPNITSEASAWLQHAANGSDPDSNHASEILAHCSAKIHRSPRSAEHLGSPEQPAPRRKSNTHPKPGTRRWMSGRPGSFNDRPELDGGQSKRTVNCAQSRPSEVT